MPAFMQNYNLLWERDYQRLLVKFLKNHKTFAGSDVCAWMRKQGLGEPLHHNHWPTQIAYYAGQQWFKKIGSVRPTTSHSHIGEVALWESLLYKGKK
jgi:hypothetical protein